MVRAVRRSRSLAVLVFRGVSAGDLLGVGPAGPDAARMRDGKTAVGRAADPDLGADGKTVVRRSELSALHFVEMPGIEDGACGPSLALLGRVGL